jgi:hypothetical protein
MSSSSSPLEKEYECSACGGPLPAHLLEFGRCYPCIDLGRYSKESDWNRKHQKSSTSDYDRIEDELRSEGIDPWKPIGDRNK